MQDIYTEWIARKLTQDENIFICYRGATRIGGAVAQILYYNLLASKYGELVPFCAPLCNDFDNFEKQSKQAINKCKVFIPIFTDYFFEPEKASDDQVRKEFIMLAREQLESQGNIQIVPVFVDYSDNKRGSANSKRRGKKFFAPAVFGDAFREWFLGPANTEPENKSAAKNGITENNIDLWKKMFPEDTAKDKGYSEDTMKMALENICNETIAHCSDGYVIEFTSPITDKIADIVAKVNDLFNERPTIENGLVWIGPRLSDISQVKDNLIKGAITLFGENDLQKNHNAMCDDTYCRRVDHNRIDPEQDAFIFDTAESISSKDKNAKFYFYNQLSYYNVFKEGKDGSRKSLGEVLRDRCVCVNDRVLLEELSNKKLFHQNYGVVGNGQGLLDVKEGNYADCDYRRICAKFGVDPDKEYKFIVQDTIASGGSGTYILTKDNEAILRKTLPQGSEYLYSIYREDNVPVNMHAIIFDDGVLFTPGSIQVMRADFDGIDGNAEVRKLMYRGADFVEYARIAGLEDSTENKVNRRHIQKFQDLCKELCEKIKEKGYIGILGIDGMIYEDEVRLLEVNCRFQASSALINRALKEKKYPSLQEINIAAWSKGLCASYEPYFKGLQVKYSNYSYNYIGEDEHVARVLQACEKKAPFVRDVEKDGYSPVDTDKRKYDNTAHLFRVVVDANICWVNEDGAVNLDECVCEPTKEFKNKIMRLATSQGVKKVSASGLLALKIALLTQGVQFRCSDLEKLKKKVRPATNDAVDIVFGEKFYSVVINAPLKNKFQAFTPFDLIPIDMDKMAFDLTYYGERIASVNLYKTDPLEWNADGTPRRTRSGFEYRDVAYLSTDRLRVHVTNQCIFKAKNTSCKFCNIIPTCHDIDLGAIEEVIQAHWSERETSGLQHFLIGGQSPEQNQKTIEKVVKIIEIIKRIGGAADPKIYAMILPCSAEGIREMREAGLTQLSFNIEIFDDVCAQKYMPGKGSISRREYKEKLLIARQEWLATTSAQRKPEVMQQIRAMVILGLEPRASFMEGIQWMIQNGIQPIISLFRPLEGEMVNCVAPSMTAVYRMYFQIQKAIDAYYGYADDTCIRYYSLGPDCKCCQNNTLSLPSEIHAEEEE